VPFAEWGPIRPTMHRNLLLLRALIAAVVLVAGAGCADQHPSARSTTPTTDLLDAVTAPPRRIPPSSTAPRPDTRDVQLTPVTGPTPVPEPLEIYGGDATLSGSFGYDGEPVAGATVQLERWVDGRMTSVELTTGPGGGWQASGIHGGRYVIRAWKGTRLVLAQASAVFIAEDEARAVHLAMTEVVVPDDEKDDEDDDKKDDEDDDHKKDDDEDTTTTTEDDG
jgi:hypothetical protein